MKFQLAILFAAALTLQQPGLPGPGPGTVHTVGGGSTPTVGNLSATNCQNFSGTTLTCVITVVSGRQLVFIINAQAGGGTVSGSANCNGTWTTDTLVTFTSISTSAATGTGSCTVTLTATSGVHNMMGIEIAGSSGIDVRGAALIDRAGIGAATPFNLAAVTTVASNDLVVGLVFDNNAGASTATAGSGFSIALQSTTTNMFVETGAKASPGAITPAMTLTNGSNPIVATISYKP